MCLTAESTILCTLAVTYCRLSRSPRRFKKSWMSKDKALEGSLRRVHPLVLDRFSEGTEKIKSEACNWCELLQDAPGFPYSERRKFSLLKEVTMSIPQSQAAFSTKDRVEGFSNSSGLSKTPAVVH